MISNSANGVDIFVKDLNSFKYEMLHTVSMSAALDKKGKELKLRSNHEALETRRGRQSPL